MNKIDAKKQEEKEEGILLSQRVHRWYCIKVNDITSSMSIALVRVLFMLILIKITSIIYVVFFWYKLKINISCCIIYTWIYMYFVIIYFKLQTVIKIMHWFRVHWKTLDWVSRTNDKRFPQAIICTNLKKYVL